LQGLFNHAPHLHYLYISQHASLSLQMSLFKYAHASVRHLYLQEYNYPFNEEKSINEFHDGHLSNNDDLVQWLKDNLSSKYFISRDLDSANCVRLWIQ
jgi:hypothetical protein